MTVSQMRTGEKWHSFTFLSHTKFRFLGSKFSASDRSPISRPSKIICTRQNLVQTIPRTYYPKHSFCSKQLDYTRRGVWPRRGSCIGSAGQSCGRRMRTFLRTSENDHFLTHLNRDNILAKTVILGPKNGHFCSGRTDRQT